ncbi:MAG: hypothetical protein HC927_07310 [Deltaproteobacteria bacterium]|nr:hypothetical protein [Deltaproteobacteria bacterium]
MFVDAGVLAPRFADALEEWIDVHGLDLTYRDEGGPAHGGVIYDPLAVLLGCGSVERSFDSLLGDCSIRCSAPARA